MEANPTTLLELASPKGYVSILEFLIVILEIAYIIFSFIQIRQVALMNQSFKTSAKPLFSILAGINFLASILLVIISIIVL